MLKTNVSPIEKLYRDTNHNFTYMYMIYIFMKINTVKKR